MSSCGYTVLTESAEAGVDLFVKKKKKSLFVHFQGHPEYGAQTLLKEYRRDIKRFLRQERETYPTMPAGYFDESAAKLLNDFRYSALSDPREEVAALFPESSVIRGLQNSWQPSATCVYTKLAAVFDVSKVRTCSICSNGARRIYALNLGRR